MKFKAKIQGTDVTSIEVPPSVIEKLGSGKKAAVVVTLNKYSYRTTITNMNGASWLVLNKENRKNAGVAGGQELEIDIVIDNQPQTVDVPAELQKLFSKNKAAQQNFEKLTFSKKRNLILTITSAKTEETKIKRIEKVLQELSN